VNLATSKQLGSGKVEEADEAVGEGADHVGLELVHRNTEALLPRNDELLLVL